MKNIIKYPANPHEITIKCPTNLLTFPPLATRTVRRVQPVKGGEELGSGSVGTWLFMVEDGDGNWESLILYWDTPYISIYHINIGIPIS